MLPGIASAVGGASGIGNVPFYGAIVSLGLTTGLQFCVDAGDILSITSASPTKWLDRSGNGYDFNFGSGSGSDAADPTFTGTPGGNSSSEYLALDGGDYLTYDTTNETFMDALHKNSALFAWACWYYRTTAGRFFLGTHSTDAGIGIGIGGNGGTTPRVLVGNGSSSQNFDSSLLLTENAWNFHAGRLDEASNSLALSAWP